MPTTVVSGAASSSSSAYYKIILGVLIVALVLLLVGIVMTHRGGNLTIPLGRRPYAVAMLRRSVKAHEIGVYDGYFIKGPRTG